MKIDDTADKLVLKLMAYNPHKTYRDLRADICDMFESGSIPKAAYDRWIEAINRLDPLS